jgi:uncharacterized membrane protein YsdA (DUF1294 family)
MFKYMLFYLFLSLKRCYNRAMKYFIYYLIVINVFSFILVYIDKKKAIKNKWRVREFYLFLSSILGGCFGFLLSMYLFHHKTKKIKFILLIPIISVIWLIVLVEVIGK